MLVEGRVAGFQLTIVVDCKYFSKKVDVKDVDSFLGYLHDLRASKGVLITNSGYTEAAYNRAMYDTRDVELRIIDFQDLEDFQGFVAIPYFGQHGAIISAPDGWIVDANPPKPQLAALYPAGLREREAFHTEGYIYFSYSLKDDYWPDLEHLLRVQEDNIRRHYDSPHIEYETLDFRDDCEVRVRHMEPKEVPNTVESTLFLDFPGAIIFLNLLAPYKKHSDYLKKFYWTAQKMIKVNVIYDGAERPTSMWKTDNNA